MVWEERINFFEIMAQAKKLYSRSLEPVCERWNLNRCELDVLLFLYNNPFYDRATDVATRRGIATSPCPSRIWSGGVFFAGNMIRGTGAMPT